MELKVVGKGDWVQGRTRNGEFVHGYVDNVDSERGMIKVKVIKSDNEKGIGKSIWIINRYVERLPNSAITSENELLSLIDVALLTKDEEWFSELSETLNSMKQISNNKNRKFDTLINRNRFVNIDSKQ